jgi:hypothetical protein
MNREKIIKEYEDYVNSYISLTTSHDSEFEMHKGFVRLGKPNHGCAIKNSMLNTHTPIQKLLNQLRTHLTAHRLTVNHGYRLNVFVHKVVRDQLGFTGSGGKIRTVLIKAVVGRHNDPKIVTQPGIQVFQTIPSAERTSQHHDHRIFLLAKYFEYHG